MQFCDNIAGVKGCTAGVYQSCTKLKGLNCSTCSEVYLHKGYVIDVWFSWFERDARDLARNSVFFLAKYVPYVGPVGKRTNAVSSAPFNMPSTPFNWHFTEKYFTGIDPQVRSNILSKSFSRGSRILFLNLGFVLKTVSHT